MPSRTLLLRLLTTSCLASLAGCASSISGSSTDAGDAAVDVVTAPDVITAPDTITAPDAPRGECINVRECAGRPMPSGALFSRNWSCIVDTCAWEPLGGQTCYARPDGCLFCDRSAELDCRDAACRAPLDPAAIRVESANCARDFFRYVASCQGRFVRLTDNTTCLLTEAPTGAIRYVLSCGPCEVVFTPR